MVMLADYFVGKVSSPNPNWLTKANVNDDEIVDTKDLVYMASNLKDPTNYPI